MKKQQISSVAIMWISFALTIISVLVMFVPLMQCQGTVYAAACNNAFFGNSIIKGAWPSFIGYMLVLVSSIMVMILALPFFQPSFQAEKCILITATVLDVVGSALIWMIVLFWCAFNGNLSTMMSGQYFPLAGTYIAGILSLVGAGLNIYALKLDA